MRIHIKALLALLLIAAPLGLAQTAAHAPDKAEEKDCDDLHIRYTPIDAHFAARMVVQTSNDPHPQGNPQLSPQRTRWMRVSSIDYSKAGPWTTSIWIGGSENEPSIKFTLREHEGFSVQWLNEKLIYGSVSWSKVEGSVFIFDVESKKFIYQEMENSGELNEVCQ